MSASSIIVHLMGSAVVYAARRGGGRGELMSCDALIPRQEAVPLAGTGRRQGGSFFSPGRPLDRLFCAAQAEEDRRQWRPGLRSSLMREERTRHDMGPLTTYLFRSDRTRPGIWRVASYQGGAATEITHIRMHAKREISHDLAAGAAGSSDDALRRAGAARVPTST